MFSFMFDLMEEPLISTVDGSLQLKRWLLQLVAFIKLISNKLKSSSDDVSNAFFFFFGGGFTLCKAEHPQRSMELQENEAQKD